MTCSLSYLELKKGLIKWSQTWVSQKTEHSIIRETPNCRKTMLGKCPVFQERVPPDLGIPSPVSGKDLEDVVCKAVTKTGVEVSDKDVEDCHWVGKSSQTIAKFCKRKVSKQVLNVRKKLDKIVDGELATDWLQQVTASCMLTRAYALTTEYWGRRVNLYIEWVKYFHITCHMVV